MLEDDLLFLIGYFTLIPREMLLIPEYWQGKGAVGA